MSLEQFQAFVIGGTEPPAIVKVSGNRITNRFFDRNCAGWTAGGSGYVGRKEVSDFEFGDHVCLVTDMSNANFSFAETSWTEGTLGVAGILVGFWAKWHGGSISGKVSIEINGTAIDRSMSWKNSWTFYSAYVAPVTLSSGTIRVRIYPCDNIASTGSVYFGNCRAYRVQELLTFAHPDGISESGKDDVGKLYSFGRNVDVLEERKRIRIAWSLNYPYRNRIDEHGYRKVLNAANLVFFPHWRDNSRFFEVVAEPANSSLFQDKFLGYRGGLGLTSVESFRELPRRGGNE